MLNLSLMHFNFNSATERDQKLGSWHRQICSAIGLLADLVFDPDLPNSHLYSTPQVVQCLTELGLGICRARISSDGGWFVDGKPIANGQQKQQLTPQHIITLYHDAAGVARTWRPRVTFLLIKLP